MSFVLTACSQEENMGLDYYKENPKIAEEKNNQCREKNEKSDNCTHAKRAVSWHFNGGGKSVDYSRSALQEDGKKELNNMIDSSK